MIDEALNSIKLLRVANSMPMIKRARRAPFYWRSFLDPEADAFDATRQELLDSYDRLMKNYDQATDTINFNGVAIPRAAIGHLYDAAWLNNNSLASERRNHDSGKVWTGMGFGGLGGTILGGWGGKKLIKLLGGGDTAQKWGGRIGNILGGLLGLGIGGHIATKYKEKNMPSTIGNGSSILRDLNTDLNNLYTRRSGGRNKLTGDAANMLDTSKPDNAKSEKLKNKK